MFLSRFVITQLLLLLCLSIVAIDASAGHRTSKSTNACLSKQKIKSIALKALPELQAIDPSITRYDLKTVVLSIGDCITYDALNTTLKDYRDELITRSGSESNNAVPAISGEPDNSVLEGQFYIFTPTASDTDNDVLSFTITDLPAWAEFDTGTGAVYGTPSNQDVGSYDNITITVSDSSASASMSGFNIEVLAAPIAKPDNPMLDQITGYSISLGTSRENLSLKMTLGTGPEVSGRRRLQSSDTYFLSIVTHDGDGNNAFLSNPDIGGYRVYAGTRSDTLIPIKELVSGPETVFKVSGLSTGIYYLSVSAVDKQGNEGPLSNIVKIKLL